MIKDVKAIPCTTSSQPWKTGRTMFSSAQPFHRSALHPGSVPDCQGVNRRLIRSRRRPTGAAGGHPGNRTDACPATECVIDIGVRQGRQDACLPGWACEEIPGKVDSMGVGAGVEATARRGTRGYSRQRRQRRRWYGSRVGAGVGVGVL